MKVCVGLLGLSLCLGCKDQAIRKGLVGGGSSRFEKKIETEIHLITVQYVSRSMLLLSRAGLSGDTHGSEALIDSLEKTESLPPGRRFLITLSPKNPSLPGSVENDVIYGSRNGFGNYKEALEAYQTGLREKIWIEKDGKKIPMAEYHMENTFGMTPSRNFLLVFPEDDLEGNRSVKLVLDGISPGMQREKLEFEIPMERYATSQ